MQRKSNFVRDRIKEYGITKIVLSGLASVGTIVSLIDFFLDPVNDCLMLWSVAVTFFFFSIFMVLNYAFYTESILKDEVERCAKAKALLEHEVLKRRKSSSKRKG